MSRSRSTGRARRGLAGLACLALVACGGAGSGRPPAATGAARDVVLITVDTLRYDATGFSGRGRVETPVADRLAADGAVFSFAHAHAVVTLPSHASILTGRYPYEHGIHDNAGYVLDERFPTLAGVLREAGYTTGAFVSSYPLDRRFGLDRGFDVYDDEYDGYGAPAFTPAERPGHVTVERALDWWREAGGKPRFLWVHLFTPHYPYDPPPDLAERYAGAAYYGDAAWADAQLEPLVRELDAAPHAIVVYTADHGEGLGEHGERTHGLFAYEATLHVPLVIRAAGLVDAVTTGEPARHIDLLPTILELAGVEAPPALPGRSLFSGDPAGSADSYFEALSAHINLGWAPLLGRLEGRTKAIELPLRELYDLGADPAEANNLAAKRTAELDAILARLPEPFDPREQRSAPDEEQIARLRALGYLAGSSPPRETYDASTDPKNLVRFDAMVDTALARFRAGDVEQAARILRDVIEQQPTMALAYSHLAFFYTDTGRLDAAIDVLRRALSRGVSNESIRRKLALNLSRAGSAAEAWDVLTPDRASTDPETQSALGRIAATRGDLDEARSRFRRALELDPTFPTALVDLGTLSMMQGRFEEARPRIEAALAQDPFLADGWNALGAIRSKAGEAEGAIEAWRRALSIDPRLSDSLYNLAFALARAGDEAGAAEALERYKRLVPEAEGARAEAQIRGVGRRGAPGD